MALLNFTLSEEGVSAFRDALICLNKFSDDVSLEARKDSVGTIPTRIISPLAHTYCSLSSLPSTLPNPHTQVSNSRPASSSRVTSTKAVASSGIASTAPSTFGWVLTRDRHLYFMILISCAGSNLIVPESHRHRHTERCREADADRQV